MFDSVIRPDQLPGRRFGTGAVVSVILHATMLGLALWLAKQAPAFHKPEVVVTFLRPAPPPPPPPPPPKAKPKTERIEPKKTVKRPDTIYQQKEPSKEPPPSDPAPNEDEGVEGGVEGGVVGGVVGGVIGGIVAPPTGPLKFNDQMTDPVKISGPKPEYTEKALEHEVQGEMIVQCILSVEGMVRDCHVTKSLPFMDRAVVDTLKKSRYKPAVWQGKPVEVEYNFRIKLVLPQ